MSNFPLECCELWSKKQCNTIWYFEISISISPQKEQHHKSSTIFILHLNILQGSEGFAINMFLFGVSVFETSPQKRLTLIVIHLFEWFNQGDMRCVHGFCKGYHAVDGCNHANHELGSSFYDLRPFYDITMHSVGVFVQDFNLHQTVPLMKEVLHQYGKYPIIYRVLYIQTVVGLGISEPCNRSRLLYQWNPFVVCVCFLIDVPRHLLHMTSGIQDYDGEAFSTAQFANRSKVRTQMRWCIYIGMLDDAEIRGEQVRYIFRNKEWSNVELL